MGRLAGLVSLIGFAAFFTLHPAAAQDLVIANARIIIGNGQVIERGAVVVKSGRIAAVITGRAPASSRGIKIDGAGKTVIAGYIDTHRHIVQRPGPSPIGPANVIPIDTFLKDDAGAAMRDLLEAGFTTVQAGGDDPEGIMKLKQLVESGQIKGPRLLTCASVPAAQMKDADAVRAAIDEAKSAGFDSICEQIFPVVPWPVNPSEHEKANLAAAAAEAKKVGILLQVHAVSPQAMVGATQLGAIRFVHSAHFDWMTPEQAHEIRDAGAMVASSTNVPGAVFDVFSHDDQPHYRSGNHWPEGDKSGEGQGRAAAYMPLNLRTLYDNGVEVAFSGDAFPYTSKTPYQQGKVSEQEFKTLNLLFSPQDMILILGQHSADFINHAEDRGTLEVGKLADILVLNGNPLDGYWNFLNPLIVIKGGEIVVDKRSTARKRR